MILADERRGHLAGDEDHRRAVHHRGVNAGDEVGRAGARGGHRDAHLASGAGIAVSHVGGALLVPYKYVVNAVVQHRIVGGEDGSTGVAEDRLDPHVRQHFPDDLRPCAPRGHPLRAAIGLMTRNRQLL